MNKRVVVAVVIVFREKHPWYMYTFSSGDAAAGSGLYSHLQNSVFPAGWPLQSQLAVSASYISLSAGRPPSFRNILERLLCFP